MRYMILITLFCFGCHKASEQIKPPPKVHVVKPTIETVEIARSYVGQVQPFLQVEVKAQVEGVLTGAYFKEGNEVKEGDLIFTIDSRPFQAQLKKAEGALAQSLASLRYAEDVAKRNAPLVQEDFVSKVQYDEYVTNVLTYKAQIKENQADIETAKINIGYCNIHAPMNAITGIIRLQVGNLIPNDGPTPLVTLNQITPIYTYFSVPQKELAEIRKLHSEKTLPIRAYLEGRGEPIAGKLDLIDNQVNDQTGSIWMRGFFSNENKELWPGEFTDIKLVLGHRENALLIPTEAISFGQKGKYVFVIGKDDTTDIRWVETAERIGNMTVIEKGVGPDDQVVIKGQVNLGKGTKVVIQENK